ncbi:hypothetical protein SPRG_17379 [Saprolegnia parasitica CBS 223.65]|uniref:MYND-type domain-containing protein n=1 Tax=Saprolegnia parasitica (strain CBS 223.65) TaxID=695850 RepID=A0A067BGH1_SAPPC|nr:hypothetical protein SPRG_17379 [Saprolegnia parasitica CBS 223.65]KDO17213.1 hypothetical protein SPRG_17379 [Saprolegnia parasitica CBS 223.65]|eukprot:XP_012212080.1 hypothetical protein SPRG_17379 [Saprolegnia parasitica CBS 223.65]
MAGRAPPNRAPPNAPNGFPDMNMLQAMLNDKKRNGDTHISDDDDNASDDEDTYDDDGNVNERLDMFGNPMPRSTRRKPASAARLELRLKQMFVPRRCEVVDCDLDGADVKPCGKCRCVFYCGRDHQRQDWARHKIDCKHIASIGVSGIPYDEDEELEKFPFDVFPVVNSTVDTCFVCGAGESEVHLGVTECCGLVVCDNEHEYLMGSYSRKHCWRSHGKYTTCGYHKTQGHRHPDWRTCPHMECLKQRENRSDPRGGGGGRSWYATNGFNATPMLASDIPKGSMLTGKCAACPRRIADGWDNVAMTKNGTLCTVCGKVPPGAPPGGVSFQLH